MGDTYRTYILEMVRNNGNIEHDRKKAKSKGSFFMFDYFDVLYCKELTGEEKRYLDYFTIKDTFSNNEDYKVSSKSLSLYQHMNEIKYNPFEIENGEKLSSKPFIGIIQISLCKENFEVRDNEKRCEINEFLIMCETEIEKTIQEKIKVCNLENISKQLYRSSTTGDFCLILRTDSVETIYSIALALNDTQYNNEGIRVLTYTSVGLECRMMKNREYSTFSESFINEHKDMMFALRISANDTFGKMVEEYEGARNGNRSNSRYERIKGLFGRYDYLWNISIEEFAGIYPILCKKKFGGINVSRGKIGEGTDLKSIIQHSHIRKINERILVDLNALKSERKDIAFITDEIGDKNKELYEKIKKLKEWKNDFAEEHLTFQDLRRGTVEIYKAFSALGMEKDAYINWIIFHKDMNILCKNLNQWMKYIKECNAGEIEKKNLRLRMLESWRVNLQAINQYTKLVQNVNYQTYQSPIYEIQTQIDTEKTLIAYRELMQNYMHLYVRKYCQVNKRKDEFPSDMIYPIIYPDLSKDGVSVIAPFNREGAKGKREREIVCTVPSFEYFGRLYDLLPWIVHECSHHIRILERKERNEFVVYYVLKYIFTEIVTDVMESLADGNLYYGLGEEEYKLIDRMTEAAERIIEEGGCLKDCDLSQTKKKLEEFLDSLFIDEIPNQPRLIREIGGSKKLKEKAFNYILDECHKEELLGEDADILEGLHKIKKLENVSFNVEKVVECLLERYNEYIEGTGQDVITIEFKDFGESVQFLERKLKNIEKKGLKQYCFSVKQLYRAYKIYKMEGIDSTGRSQNLQALFEKTFDIYREEKCNDGQVSDPVIMYIMRNIGLLNWERDLFCSKMKDMFARIDERQVLQMEEFRISVYREACADLLMVTSLNIDSFGYCHQILKTISDAKMELERYRFADINYERFRIVTAVLLAEEYKGKLEKGDRGEVKVDASVLLKKGKKYCLNILKHVRTKVLNNSDNKLTEKKKKLITRFLEDVYGQIDISWEKLDSVTYKKTFLYRLLYQDESKIEKVLINRWKEYEKIISYLEDEKYLFWRLECFCQGIFNIVEEGYIYVSEKFFKHMWKIRASIKENSTQGCIWENNISKELAASKIDVGKFYNKPEQVYLKSEKEKLENTINFIQNYYYFNRFRIMNEEKQ